MSHLEQVVDQSNTTRSQNRTFDERVNIVILTGISAYIHYSLEHVPHLNEEENNLNVGRDLYIFFTIMIILNFQIYFYNLSEII